MAKEAIKAPIVTSPGSRNIKAKKAAPTTTMKIDNKRFTFTVNSSVQSDVSSINPFPFFGKIKVITKKNNMILQIQKFKSLENTKAIIMRC